MELAGRAPLRKRPAQFTIGIAEKPMEKMNG
jgi:hypothetical protein